MTESSVFYEKHSPIEYGVLGDTYVFANEQEFEETYIEMETGEEKTRTAYRYDIAKVPVKYKTDEEVIANLKEQKLNEITEYDTSSNVNVFSLNGTDAWLDRDTRVSLMNSTTIEKASGKTSTTLWFGSMKIEVGVDKAIDLLSGLEMYALECYNKTAEHKNNVEALTAIDDIVSYDYTKGYPEKLEINTGFLEE